MNYPKKKFYSVKELAETRWQGTTEKDILEWAIAEEVTISVFLKHVFKAEWDYGKDGSTIDDIKPIGERFGIYAIVDSWHIEEMFHEDADAFETFSFIDHKDGKRFCNIKGDGKKYRPAYLAIPRGKLLLMPEEVSRLDAALGQAAIIAKVLDDTHPWHSKRLACAVKAWRELYESREGNGMDNAFKPKGGNIVFIDDWLKKNAQDIDAHEHIAIVVNPSQKSGPRSQP